MNENVDILLKLIEGEFRIQKNMIKVREAAKLDLLNLSDSTLHLLAKSKFSEALKSIQISKARIHALQKVLKQQKRLQHAK